jgi:hypothetical protein
VDRPFRVREPSSAESLVATFQSGQTYAEMVATAKSQADLFAHFRGRASAAPEYLARIERTGRRWHLLAVSEDWCGDSVNILPWVDALDAGSPLVELRIIERDRHLDLMDQHLTNGRSRSIPIVILLDDRFVERAWWGPRALEMQQWFETPEAQALSKDARYKELRIRYSRDRGRAILEEITSMIGFAAARDARPDTAQVTSATNSAPAIVSAAP